MLSTGINLKVNSCFFLLIIAVMVTSCGAFFHGTTDGECKAPVFDKLHDDSYHVFVGQKSEQLVGESMVPESVISSSQIYKHGTGLFFFCFKTVFNVLGQQLLDHG